MSAAILTTKLSVPTLPGQRTPRPRLIERLDAGLTCKLTLVCAPAGFGKTTLLAEWMAQGDDSFAWLSLDKQDNDPIFFLTYLAAALQTVDEELGETALSLLQSPQPPAPPNCSPRLTRGRRPLSPLPTLRRMKKALRPFLPTWPSGWPSRSANASKKCWRWSPRG
jgi:hypothetical protein